MGITKYQYGLCRLIGKSVAGRNSIRASLLPQLSLNPVWGGTDVRPCFKYRTIARQNGRVDYISARQSRLPQAVQHEVHMRNPVRSKKGRLRTAAFALAAATF